MGDTLSVPTMAAMVAAGKKPEVLFWVGCAGSFDDSAKGISRAFVKILDRCGIEFAVLGTEEGCTGDPAKRAGNEFLFQMQAFANIERLDGYGVKRIVCTCPHCFNTLKNEYPDLGGDYEVLHHTQFIDELLATGRLRIEGQAYAGKRITFHDPCYLGRGNGVYEAPRRLIEELDAELVEMKRCKRQSFCCGAGGAQLFKEPEKGDRDVNIARTEQALKTKSHVIATGCPFCHIMMADGVRRKEKEADIDVLDLAELIARAADL